MGKKHNLLKQEQRHTKVTLKTANEAVMVNIRLMTEAFMLVIFLTESKMEKENSLGQTDARMMETGLITRCMARE